MEAANDVWAALSVAAAGKASIDGANVDLPDFRPLKINMLFIPWTPPFLLGIKNILPGLTLAFVSKNVPNYTVETSTSLRLHASS